MSHHCHFPFLFQSIITFPVFPETQHRILFPSYKPSEPLCFSEHIPVDGLNYIVPVSLPELQILLCFPKCRCYPHCSHPSSAYSTFVPSSAIYGSTFHFSLFPYHSHLLPQLLPIPIVILFVCGSYGIDPLVLNGCCTVPKVLISYGRYDIPVIAVNAFCPFT